MAFGLDRLITVRVTTGERDDNGQYQETNHDSRRWATRMDQSLDRVLNSYGAYSSASRVYRVRWYERLAGASATAVKVFDGVTVFNGSNIVEVEGRAEYERRRKFLDIECTAEIP